MAPAGPLDPPRPAAAWAVATRINRAQAWGQFLAFLESEGMLDEHSPPAQRLTQQRLTRFIESMRSRLNANTVHQAVVNLSYAIAAMAPEQDWRWVRRHPGRPRPTEVAASRKPVQPFDPVGFLRKTLELWEDANRAAPGPAASVRARNAVLAMVATTTALRRKNLAQLRLGREVQIFEDHVRLFIPADDTKTGQAIDLRLARFVEPCLRGYVLEHRPRLLGEGHSDALWIGLDGRPLAYSAFYALLARLGVRLLGRPVNPHLVRHSQATSILLDNPRAVRTASAALAHKSPRILLERYDRSGAEPAQRAWRALVARARRGA